MESQPVTKPKRSSSLPLIILIILLLVSLVTSGYLYYQNRQLQTQISSLQITTPSPQPAISADPTFAWLTYANSKYGFSVRYDPQFKPDENIGTEDVGQFTYLFLVDFGDDLTKKNHQFNVEINHGDSLETYKTDLIGHITDAIDKTENLTINGITWTKLTYSHAMGESTHQDTLAFTVQGDYGYAVTASTADIDLILPTFQFTQ